MAEWNESVIEWMRRDGKERKKIGRRRECVRDGSHLPPPSFRRLITSSHYENGTGLLIHSLNLEKNGRFLTDMIAQVLIRVDSSNRIYDRTI